MNEDNNNPEINGTGDMNNMSNDFGNLPGFDQNSNTMPGMDGQMGGMPGMNDQMGGMPGMDGQFGEMPGMNDQMGGMPGMNDQMGGMPGMDGQMGGMPGMDGQMGEMPGMDGQMGGMPGMDGQMGGMPGIDGQFGEMPGIDGQMGGMPGMDGQMGGMPGMDDQMGGMPGMDGQMGGMSGMDDQMGGMPGMNNQMGGMPGMDDQMGGMPGMDGQFGEMSGMDGQMGGMPGMDGQMGEMPGMDGQMGEMPGMDGQMGGMPGMDGQFDGMSGGGVQGEVARQDYGNDDMAFVQAWMGSIYDKAHSSKFNWCAALFNGGYLLYRKMYTTGSIVLVLQLVFFAISMLIIGKSLIASIIILALFSIGIFVGLGLGFYPLYRSFVKGKLNSMKEQVNDQSRLISVAEQKGGTSVLGVIVYYLALSVLLGVITTTLAAGAISGLTGAGKPSTPVENINLNEVNNIIEEPPIDEGVKFYFYENYFLTCDNEWFYDETGNKLTKGDYVFTLYETYTKERTQMDLSTAEGRKQLLDYLSSALTQMATQANWQVNVGNENFIPQEKIFYNYIDFTGQNTIQRMYFVVVPEDSILFEFILTINNTSIETTTNTSIVEMLSTIKKDTASKQETGTGENVTANVVEANTVVEDGNTISNQVTNTLVPEENVNVTPAQQEMVDQQNQVGGQSTTITTQPSLTQTLQ